MVAALRRVASMLTYQALRLLLSARFRVVRCPDSGAATREHQECATSDYFPG